MVVLVQTRKPARLAAMMPSTAALNTPSRSTARSCVSSKPSRWTLKKKRLVGSKLVQAFLDEHAVGAEVNVLAALEDAAN